MQNILARIVDENRIIQQNTPMRLSYYKIPRHLFVAARQGWHHGATDDAIQLGASLFIPYDGDDVELVFNDDDTALALRMKILNREYKDKELKNLSYPEYCHVCGTRCTDYVIFHEDSKNRNYFICYTCASKIKSLV